VAPPLVCAISQAIAVRWSDMGIRYDCSWRIQTAKQSDRCHRSALWRESSPCNGRQQGGRIADPVVMENIPQEEVGWSAPVANGGESGAKAS
jgi:hypothetical protein